MAISVIRREFTADYVNKVANDPSVKHGSGFTWVPDFSGFIANPENIVLAYEGGAFALAPKGDHIYEVHTMATKAGRGPLLRQAISEAIDYMASIMGCKKLVTYANKNNPAAVVLARHYFQQTKETDEAYFYEMELT